MQYNDHVMKEVDPNEEHYKYRDTSDDYYKCDDVAALEAENANLRKQLKDSDDLLFIAYLDGVHQGKKTLKTKESS
jgi:hypothetical protein